MERIYLSPPHMGDDERSLLLEAFDSNWIAPLGPHVDAFEAEFAAAVGAPHAAALASGTGALHLALILSGVQAGDDVLTSSLTFAATANCITYVGAKPSFIDSNATTWNLDPELLAAELDDRAKKNKLPKALIVVHLYGQCADMDPILAACAKHGVAVIEDAAEALGATYKGRAAGTFAPLAVFSFNGNKIITTSGGGMLVGTDAALIERARYLATQARDPAPHYQHSTIGFNYRLSNLLAAVGRGQLRVLRARVEARRANNAFYRQALGGLPGLTFMPNAAYGEPTNWLTCVTIDPEVFGVSAEAVRLHLGTLDIEARPVWKPMHLQPVFSECAMRGGAVAESLFSRGLCLPSGSSLTAEQRQRVVDGVLGVRETSSTSSRTLRGSPATNSETAPE
jgi:pyridoxal phosphate-dependent aminotransferase EpsN